MNFKNRAIVTGKNHIKPKRLSWAVAAVLGALSFPLFAADCTDSLNDQIITSIAGGSVIIASNGHACASRNQIYLDGETNTAFGPLKDLIAARARDSLQDNKVVIDNSTLFVERIIGAVTDAENNTIDPARITLKL